MPRPAHTYFVMFRSRATRQGVTIRVRATSFSAARNAAKPMAVDRLARPSRDVSWEGTERP